MNLIMDKISRENLVQNLNLVNSRMFHGFRLLKSSRKQRKRSLSTRQMSVI